MGGLLIAACLFASAAMNAQSTSVPTLHVATRRIELSVSVLDRKTGQPVTSLGAADFRLTSDGANLPITYFGAPGHTRPLAVYLVVRNDPIDTTALRRLATELPDALNVLPADTQLAIASYNGVNNSLWLHPTDDRQSVLAALQQIVAASQFNKAKPGTKSAKTAAKEDQKDNALLDKVTAKVDKATAKAAARSGEAATEDATQPTAAAGPSEADRTEQTEAATGTPTAVTTGATVGVPVEHPTGAKVEAAPGAAAPPTVASPSSGAVGSPSTPAPAAVVSDDISNAQSLKKVLTTYNMGSADAIHLVEADWDRRGDTAYQPMLIVIDDELSFCYIWYALKLHNELLRQGMTLDELQEPHGGFSRAMVGFTKVWAPTGIPLDPENAFIRYRYESYLAKASGGEVVSIRTTGYKAGFTQIFSHARAAYQLEFEPPASAGEAVVSGAPGTSVAGSSPPRSDTKLHGLHVELIARPGLDPSKYRILARDHYSAANPIKPATTQPSVD